MKKLIHTIILAAAFSACSDEILPAPALSFFSDKPEILDETAIFRLAVANMPAGSEYRFPVTFGGTAESGIDYEASSDAFVFGGENPVDSIVVKTLKFGTGKTVSMTVEQPEGMEGGKYMTSEYTLQGLIANVTLSGTYGILADSTYVKFSLTDDKGRAKTLSRDTEITLLVDKEKSTAVEGVDFEIADSSHFTLQAGQKGGEFKLRTLNQKAQSGKDRIALSIGYEPSLGAGESITMDIDIMDKKWNALNGKWVIDTLVTDTTYMMKFWGDKCTGYNLFPKYNRTDAVSFELDECQFKPDFLSYFYFYFTGQANLRRNTAISLDLGNGESVDLQTFIIDNTNRDFSKDSQSEDKESVIAMRILEGIEDAADTLDFYVIDYISKSFMPELEAMGKYAPEKPVAASPGQFINITFTK